MTPVLQSGDADIGEYNDGGGNMGSMYLLIGAAIVALAGLLIAGLLMAASRQEPTPDVDQREEPEELRKSA